MHVRSARTLVTKCMLIVLCDFLGAGGCGHGREDAGRPKDD